MVRESIPELPHQFLEAKRLSWLDRQELLIMASMLLQRILRGELGLNSVTNLRDDGPQP